MIRCPSCMSPHAGPRTNDELAQTLKATVDNLRRTSEAERRAGLALGVLSLIELELRGYCQPCRFTIAIGDLPSVRDRYGDFYAGLPRLELLQGGRQ